MAQQTSLILGSVVGLPEQPQPSNPPQGTLYLYADSSSGNLIALNYLGQNVLGSGSGNVSSVGLVDSTGLFTVTGSPVTTSGSLTLSAFASQTANTVLRSGSGTPSFSALVVGDFPTSGIWNFGGTISGNTAFSGTPTFSNALALGSSTCTTQATSDNSTKLANTSYVTTAVANALAGVSAATAVLAASTANIVGTYTAVGSGVGDYFTVTATGAFTLDGIAINTIGQLVLLKNQSSAYQNGVYTCTIAGTTGVSAVFTRSTSYDTVADVNTSGAIPVQSGTANVDTSWLLTNQITGIGSGHSIVYQQFTIAPSGIALLSGATFTGAVTATTFDGLTITTSTGTLTVANGKTLTASNTLTLAGTDSTTMTFPSSSDTVVTLAATQTLTNKTLTSPTMTTPVLGTPTSGTLTNCTFPTLNQSTSGSAASLSISGQTGLMTVTGLTSTNRIKTVRDAADTLLELGGSYTPTGTWTNLTLATPVLGMPQSGNLTNCTFPTLNQNTTGSSGSCTGNSATVTGLSVVSGKMLTVDNTITLAGTDSTTFTFPSSSDTVVTLAASQTLTNKTLTSPTLTTPVLGTPSSGNLGSCTAYPSSALSGQVTIAQVGSSGLSATSPLNIASTGAITLTAFSGDATNSGAAITVTGIRGIPIVSTAPTAGMVLMYHSASESPLTSEWVPGYPYKTLINVVAEYGVVADGTHDQSAAVQEAMNAVTTARPGLYFPAAASAYIISNAITDPSNGALMYLMGDGWGVTTIQTNGSNQLFTLTHVTDRSVNSLGFVIDGINFVGPSNAYTSLGTQNGVQLSNANTNGGGTNLVQLTINNCQFYGWPGSGLYITNPILSCIKNSQFQANARGCYIAGGYGESNSIINNYSHLNITADFHLYECGNVAMTGCASEQSGIGVLLDTCNNCTIISQDVEVMIPNTQAVTTVALTTDVATITVPNSYVAGQWAVVAGGTSTNAPLNGRWQIASATSAHFTFSITASNIVSNSPAGMTSSTYPGDGIQFRDSKCCSVLSYDNYASVGSTGYSAGSCAIFIDQNCVQTNIQGYFQNTTGYTNDIYIASGATRTYLQGCQPIGALFAATSCDYINVQPQASGAALATFQVSNNTSPSGISILNNTSFSLTNPLLSLQYQNASDSGNAITITNAGSGNFLSCINGSSVTVASISSAGEGTFEGNAQLGLTGTTSGVLTLCGSTSGTCTITSPATAGTVTNPIAFSNSINLNGSTCIYQQNGTSGTTHASTSITAITLNGGIVTAITTSDERLKKNIVPFKKGLNAVMALEPITFEWDSTKTPMKSDHPWTGFSAQQVSKTLPEASWPVPDDANGDAKIKGMVDFNPQVVLAAAVNAVKELNTRVWVGYGLAASAWLPWLAHFLGWLK